MSELPRPPLNSPNTWDFTLFVVPTDTWNPSSLFTTIVYRPAAGTSTKVSASPTMWSMPPLRPGMPGTPSSFTANSPRPLPLKLPASADA